MFARDIFIYRKLHNVHNVITRTNRNLKYKLFQTA